MVRRGREIERKRRTATDFWKDAVRGAERESEEFKKMIEKGEQSREEKEEKAEIERDEKPKPFFDCKEDEEITCRQDIIDAQADESSKCMNYILKHLDVWKHKRMYTKQK